MDISTINVRSAAGATGARLSVQVIGPFMVRRGSRTLTSKELGGPRQRRILEILLLQLGTPVSKQRLVDLLWGADAPAAASANLESYVSVLRRHLQPGEGKHGPLKTTNGGYVMDASMVDLDLPRFERLLDAARRSSAREANLLLRSALDLASGSLLENEQECEWIESQRSTFADRVTEARVLLAEAGLELGRCEEPVIQARKVLTADPLNERAWTVLVLGLEGAGRPVEGLQAYEQCRRTLDHELGCAPSGVLQSAYTRMLRATAATGDELGQALTALLVLHGRLGDTDWVLGTRAPLARQEAASVLQSFLGRSLSPAA
ncbi:AfsR/SARP family transcriptional regulator [Kocuria nitroreducens]|uniref:AfsR/SARP family transcriptional regulator n=1 Tax=Kocuria nitroreducens TaxID=3058914 RepID=UPI0036D95094